MDREIPAIPWGFGDRELVNRNRRPRDRGSFEALERVDLCCQVRRFELRSEADSKARICFAPDWLTRRGCTTIASWPVANSQTTKQPGTLSSPAFRYHFKSEKRFICSGPVIQEKNKELYDCLKPAERWPVGETTSGSKAMRHETVPVVRDISLSFRRRPRLVMLLVKLSSAFCLASREAETSSNRNPHHEVLRHFVLPPVVELGGARV